MRKVIAAAATALAASGAIAALAVPAGASPRIVTHCSTYVECTNPKITVVTPASTKCVKKSAKYETAKLYTAANRGIRKIVVKSGSKVLFSKTFAGSNTLEYTIARKTLAAKGLASGAHTVTVTVTDVSGAKTTKTLHFSVCATTPVFTG